MPPCLVVQVGKGGLAVRGGSVVYRFFLIVNQRVDVCLILDTPVGFRSRLVAGTAGDVCIATGRAGGGGCRGCFGGGGGPGGAAGGGGVQTPPRNWGEL